MRSSDVSSMRFSQTPPLQCDDHASSSFIEHFAYSANFQGWLPVTCKKLLAIGIDILTHIEFLQLFK